MARRTVGQQVGEHSAGGEWTGREVSPGRGIASVIYCKEVCQVCSRSQGWLRLPGWLSDGLAAHYMHPTL